MRNILLFVAVLVIPGQVLGEDAVSKADRYSRRWVFLHPGFDMRKDDQTEAMLALLERIGKAGYNGVSVPTGRLQLLHWKESDNFYANMERVRVAAEEAGLEVIPRVMGFNGYANGMLSNNPNLAAALPVRDCVLEVRDGQATIASTDNILPLGDLELFSQPDRPDGWTFVDKPGQVTFADRDVVHSGESAVRFQHFEKATDHGNCRVMKKLQVKPWQQYLISLWIKTEQVKNPSVINIALHGDVTTRQRRNLQKRQLGVRSAQDWTRYDVTVNTLNNTEVWLYIGGWNPGGGIIWLDDISIRQVAGINLLRRDGCPVTVTNEDGSVTYEEGRDFEHWEHPQMGRVRWPGQYQFMHAQPPIVLTDQSRIEDGQKLKVSYYHAQHHLNTGVSMCIAHDESFQHQREHLLRVRKYYKPKTYIAVNDEIRLAGWCEVCRKHGDNVGDVVAYNARRCFEIIREVDPDAEVIMWSDMFDPNHNAVDKYWLTRGSMKGSWEGVDKEVIIGNWNHGRSRPSMQFFSGRGHRQVIATYYDRWNWQQVTKNWLNAADDLPNMAGIMYTTWSNKYDHLEEFNQLIDDHLARKGEAPGEPE